MSKFAALSGSPIIKNYVLLALALSLLFVIQPYISLRQSVSCVRERSVSAIDKDGILGCDLHINDAFEKNTFLFFID